MTAVAADNAALSHQWEKSSDEKKLDGHRPCDDEQLCPGNSGQKIEGEQVTYYRCKGDVYPEREDGVGCVAHGGHHGQRRSSADTTISYIVTDGNEKNRQGTPAKASVSETTVVLNYAELGAKKPRIWFQPPQGGTLRVTLGTCGDPAASYDGKGDYTDRVYFREGITGTNIIHVTATAEDGVTETTYTLRSDAGRKL